MIKRFVVVIITLAMMLTACSNGAAVTTGSKAAFDSGKFEGGVYYNKTYGFKFEPMAGFGYVVKDYFEGYAADPSAEPVTADPSMSPTQKRAYLFASDLSAGQYSENPDFDLAYAFVAQNQSSEMVTLSYANDRYSKYPMDDDYANFLREQISEDFKAMPEIHVDFSELYDRTIADQACRGYTLTQTDTGWYSVSIAAVRKVDNIIIIFGTAAPSLERATELMNGFTAY